jgi:hypothetical protein
MAGEVFVFFFTAVVTDGFSVIAMRKMSPASVLADTFSPTGEKAGLRGHGKNPPASVFVTEAAEKF